MSLWHPPTWPQRKQDFVYQGPSLSTAVPSLMEGFLHTCFLVTLSVVLQSRAHSLEESRRTEASPAMQWSQTLPMLLMVWLRIRMATVGMIGMVSKTRTSAH